MQYTSPPTIVEGGVAAMDWKCVGSFLDSSGCSIPVPQPLSVMNSVKAKV